MTHAKMTVTGEHLPNSKRIRLDCGQPRDEGGKREVGGKKDLALVMHQLCE